VVREFVAKLIGDLFVEGKEDLSLEGSNCAALTMVKVLPEPATASTMSAAAASTVSTCFCTQSMTACW
jgi:hypothetical protein